MRSPQPVQAAPAIDGDEVTVADPEAATEDHPSFSPWRLVAVVAAIVALGLAVNWYLVGVILAVVAMITLHEFGHYLTARRSGMKVTEFFIGFGPRIWSFRRGEVEYGIKAIPAGAYVRIIGMMNIDEVPEADEPRTYRQKAYGPRMAVALGGIAMHAVMALVLLWIALVFTGSTDAHHWAVEQASQGSAAATVGIRHGDTVVSVAGTPVSTFEQMSAEVQKHGGQHVTVVVRRDGRLVSLPVTLGFKASIYGTVGEDIQLTSYDRAFRVESVADTGRVASAGIHDGNEVTAINGVTLTGLSDLSRAVAAGSGGTVKLTVRTGGTGASTVVRTVDLGTKVALSRTQGFLGVGSYQVLQKHGPVAAIGTSVQTIGSIGWATIEGVGRFFNPANLAHFAGRALSTKPGQTHTSTTPVSATVAEQQNLSQNSNRMLSIVGAVSLGSNLARDGWHSFLMFMVEMNIVLGIINLIPLLPFDGGHVAVATYEKIRELIRGGHARYFADANKLLPVAYAVVFVLMTVGLMAMYLDIADPLTLR